MSQKKSKSTAYPSRESKDTLIEKTPFHPPIEEKNLFELSPTDPEGVPISLHDALASSDSITSETPHKTPPTENHPTAFHHDESSSPNPFRPNEEDPLNDDAQAALGRESSENKTLSSKTLPMAEESGNDSLAENSAFPLHPSTPQPKSGNFAHEDPFGDDSTYRSSSPVVITTPTGSLQQIDLNSTNDLWNFQDETKEKNVYTIPVLPQSHFSIRYRDEGQIAKGGMSTIHKVFDRNILRHAALKVLDPALAKGKDGAQRFLEEAQITGQLEHPNIIPIYELGMDDDQRFYFTMKLVQGKTLQEHISSPEYDPSSKVALYRTLQVFLKVCDALSYAHSMGVIHRDLKPDNIMLGSHGQIYLMDWGVARWFGERPEDVSKDNAIQLLRHESHDALQEASGLVVGTPEYLSPEQALGEQEKVGIPSDIFSLGAILYEIITKRPPYTGSTPEELLFKAQNAMYFPPQVVASDRHLPPTLCQIVVQAMALDPTQRYPSVRALQDAIEHFLQGQQFPERSYTKGTKIIEEGDSGQEAYIITRGRCQVHTQIDGKPVIIDELGPGEVFGEMAFFSSQKRTAHVEALEDVQVKVVDPQALTQETGLEPWLGQFVGILAERARDLHINASQLQEEHAQQKRLNWLLTSFLLHGTQHTDNHWSLSLDTLQNAWGEFEKTHPLEKVIAHFPFFITHPDTQEIQLDRHQLREWQAQTPPHTQLFSWVT